MNNTFVKKIKSENLLVYSLVFYAMWSFFRGFSGFKGGLTDIIEAMHGSIPLLLYTVTIFFFYSRSKAYYLTDKSIKQSAFFLLAYFLLLLFPTLATGEFPKINLIIDPIIGALFFLLRDDIKVRVFDGFIKVLAILFCCSIIEYIIYITTGLYITLFDVERYRTSFHQTLFNFIPYYSDSIQDLMNSMRFQSLSEEPGCVGTTAGMLLIITSTSSRYRFQNIVFWIAGLLSFSLAFYVMALFSLLFQISSKNGIKTAIITLIAVVFLYGVFYEVIDNALFGRYEYYRENNFERSSDSLDNAIAKAWTDGSIWFGKGEREFNKVINGEGVAGASCWIFEYGILGVAIILLTYTSFFLKKTRSLKLANNFYALGFLALFWMSFYQRQNINDFQFILIFFTAPIALKYIENDNYTGTQQRRIQ